MGYTTGTGFLEHGSTVDVYTLTVPTNSPIEPLAPPPILSQSDHAIDTTTYFPSITTTSSEGFILARVIEDGFTLELRWSSFTSTPTPTTPSTSRQNDGTSPFYELDQHPGTLPPVRFIFPSRIVPSPAFNVVSSSIPQAGEEEGDEDGKQLEALVLTESGYLYSLSFPISSLFYGQPFQNPSSAEEGTINDWSEEFKVEGLKGRIPVLVRGAEEGRIVVACSDGFQETVEIAEGSDGAVIETELRSPSSFSIRSLVPSFSSQRSSPSSPLKLVSGSSTHTSSPSQLVSLAISPPSASSSSSSTFAFGVTRDRKLKIWDIDSGHCLRSIDLPKSASIASINSSALVSTNSNLSTALIEQQQPQYPKSALLLPPTPQAFVKISQSSSSSSSSTNEYGSYLTLYAPPSNDVGGGGGGGGSSSSSTGTFFIYGLAVDQHSGELNQLAPVAERLCPQGSFNLVDFEVKRMSIEGREKWSLWTVWEEGGETEVRTVGLSELDEAEDGDDDEDDQWTIVSRGPTSSTAQWTAAYFDDQLRNGPLSVQETFLRHISFPGRYPPATFDYALEMYEEVILSEYSNSGYPPPTAFEQEYDSTLIRAAAIVGCTIELNHSTQTGAPMVEEYTKRLKLEWLRFVALLNESRSAALFPLALAVDEARGLAFVVGRDSILVPVVEETVQTLETYLKRDPSSSLLQLQQPPQLSYPQSNFIPLVNLTRSVLSQLSTSESRSFESTILTRLRTPFTTDMEDISLDLFERTLEPALSAETLSNVLDGFKSFVEPTKTVESFCHLLLSTSSSSTASTLDGESQFSSTDLSNTILADLITTSISCRFELAKGLVALLLAAWGAADEEGNELPMAQLDETTSLAFSTLHTLASLQWMATQIVVPTNEAVERVIKEDIIEEGGEGSDAMMAKFGALKMGDQKGRRAETLPVTTYSLLDALLRIPPYSPTITSSNYAAIPESLSNAASDFLTSIGLLTSKPLIDSNPADVRFASILVRLGLAEQAKELVQGYPKTPGIAYVEGRADLELGDGESATVAFERAATGLFALETSLEDSSLATGGLSNVLPSDVKSISQYYIHIVSLFVPTAFDYSIARFAQLALDSIDEEEQEGDGSAEVEESTLKDLWTKLFRSWASVGEYEKAYEAIMEVPFSETKTTCLAHFISLVCENGATSLLTTLSFVGLEADLERNLAFRARNSDPLAHPDYYKVLYAYHVSKGDYRSAGTVMYQQARRIGEITNRGGSFRDLATSQCQAYLAAANALSLVAREHAWVAAVVGDDLERGNKRRKVTYHIPDDEYDPSASRPLEVRELADIRREYTVALARLQLSAEFPELERTNFHLEPEAVVALLSQTNAFEQAFNAGRVLDVDLASLFEILAEKCVGLTIHPEGSDDASWVALSPEASTWDGTLASKAWRLLERHLQRHDSAPTYRYRFVVLERVLATNQRGDLPDFLIEFLEKNAPQSLVRTLIKYDRIQDAFKFSLSTIRSSTIPSPSTSFSTDLPFSLFDQLLAIPSTDTTPSLTSEKLEALQKELREALKERIAKAEKALRR